MKEEEEKAVGKTTPRGRMVNMAAKEKKNKRLRMMKRRTKARTTMKVKEMKRRNEMRKRRICGRKTKIKK